MAKIEAFEKYFNEYEDWFEKNLSIYNEEVKTLKKLVGNKKNGLDIGIGTGRFALSIDIKIGIEPSKKMRDIALSKELNVFDGIAEELTFEDNYFDFAIMITTICFIDNLLQSFKEAFRVIKQDGFLIIGFVDRNSKFGMKYQKKSEKSKFYFNAKFYTIDEIVNALKKVGFVEFKMEYVKNTQKSFIFLKALKM